jgi:predicted aldo/keto reductase-like oxidoreductase
MAMKRRTFVRNSALGSLALGLPFDVSSNRGTPEIPRRFLGKTREKLSIIGFGGIMLNDNPQEFANEFVAKAYDAGINYFDISPEYGNAEEKLGLAFRPYRNKCFLACKTQKRDAVEAEKQLNESLKAFNTDHFDLYQLHALSSVDEVEKAFAPGGAMDVFIRAREQGKVRFLGFSAHNVEAALLAMKNFDFDTILFPINFNCWNNGDFGPQVYDIAKSKGMGILALKAMALTTLREGEKKPYKNVWYRPIQDDEIARLALRYTLSKEVTAAIPPGDAVFFWKAVELARDFNPISSAENEKLAKLATGLEPVFSHKRA